MKRIIITVFLLLGLVSGSHSLAGTAATGASFLNIGTDARAMSMGNAFTGMASGISAIHYNPSGIAGLQEKEFQASHSEWMSGMHYECMGFASPVEISIGDAFETKGAAGISLIYFSTGEIERRSLSGEKLEGNYSASDMALAFSYGQKLNNRTALGMNFKIISQTIDTENAGGFAVDLGSTHKTSVPGLSLGIAMRNLGPQMRFIQADYRLPLELSIGGTFMSRDINGYTIGMDISYQPFEERTNISFGGEYNFNSIFSFRTGYSLDAFKSGLASGNIGGLLSSAGGLSGGIGLNFPKYSIDYAFLPIGELGITHRITFSTRF